MSLTKPKRIVITFDDSETGCSISVEPNYGLIDTHYRYMQVEIVGDAYDRLIAAANSINIRLLGRQ